MRILTEGAIELFVTGIRTFGWASAPRYWTGPTPAVRPSHPQSEYASCLCPGIRQFLRPCEARGLTLATIRPHDVATYMEKTLRFNKVFGNGRLQEWPDIDLPGGP
jgi:hypothetical protein